MESRRENLVSAGAGGDRPKRERKRKLLDQNFVYEQDLERNVGFKQSWKNQVLGEIFVQVSSLLSVWFCADNP